MNPTVDLHDQAQFSTIEVRYESSDHVLSPELEAKTAPIAQQLPRGSFGSCGIVPHVPR